MTRALNRLFPQSFDNSFPGHRVALWVFYALTAVTLWRSWHHMTAPDGGAQSIAKIPLDSYSPAAASAVIGIFAYWGLSQLLIGLIYLLAAIRYRSMIPLLYLMMILEYATRIFITAFKPIETAGTAPGAVVNLPQIIVAAVMLALCLMPRKTS